MRRKFLTLALVILPLTLTACQPSKEEVAAQEARQMAELKKRMKPIAQAAADAGLFSKKACVTLDNEGRLYKTSDVNLLPETRLMRFLESQGVMVRQNVISPDGTNSQTRFFVIEQFRDNMPRKNLYCFGKWAVLEANPVKKSKATKRNGVNFYPVDLTLRLIEVPSQEWLNSRLIRENLAPSSGMTSLTKDYKIRALLPLEKEQLPPPDNAKPLDQGN